MKQLTSFILFAILMAGAFGQTTSTAPVVINGQQYVLAPTTVPPTAQAVVEKVVAVLPQGSEAERIGQNLGQSIGSSMGSVLKSFGEQTGATVDKAGAVTGNIVDKTGDALSKTADKTSDLAGQALDRTFGKDKTVVQGLNEFGNTRIGFVTMVVTSWKLLGKEAADLLKVITGIIIGVPIQIVLIGLYVWVIRRFFITRSIVTKKTGGLWSKDRVVEYVLINVVKGYNNKDTDGFKIISYIDEDAKHAGLFLSTVIFLLISSINVAQVIF